MKQVRRNGLFVLGLLAPLGASMAAGQNRRPMSIIDLLEVPQLSDPQLAPDGDQLLYLMAEADWEANERIEHIWRVNLDGTEKVQMTRGDGEEQPRWSPDGESIAFITKRGADEEKQIYLLSNQGGEAVRLSRHPSSVSDIQWSVDGAYLYFLAPDPKSEEEKKQEEAKDDVYAFDQNCQQKHLWRISVDTEQEQRLTEGDYSILSYRLSRDGKKMVFHRAPTPLYDDSDEGEVWVADSDAQGALRLTQNSVPEHDAELSPDSTQVLFVADANEKFESYFNDNLFVVPAAGGAIRMLAPEMPYEVQEASWSRDGKDIYFTANTGVRSELFRIEPATDNLEQLTRGDHALTHWSYFPKPDRQVFGIDEATNAGDVYTLPANGGEAPVRVTHVYDYLARDFALPRQEAIQWKGADGVTVEGLLYYPLDYQEGKRYPLAVQTHGGPAASDKFGFGRWRSYVQVLTARGWVVFKPNYRGSTGYGDEVLRDMVGHYFHQAHLDVMTGVDALIEKGIADPDRMIKMGWSGGGHMTNKIITFTDRFKAASSGAGAVDWVSMYAQSDVRIYRTPWFGGTPWEEDAPLDLYWESSPLKDIWKVKTPTIILVGEKDVRVPPPQSVELFRALRHNGVPTHLYIAPREPHGWQELRHELFKVNVELDWFEEHALDRDYIWEKPPEDGEVEEAERPSATR